MSAGSVVGVGVSVPVGVAVAVGCCVKVGVETGIGVDEGAAGISGGSVSLKAGIKGNGMAFASISMGIPM